MAASTKWRKILYEDQNVPDNYVDRTFLQELRKNINTRTYEYWPAVCQSGSVTQQLSSVCIFVVIFMYMDEKWLLPETVFIITSVLTLVGYVIYTQSQSIDESHHRKRTVLDDFKTSVMFGGFSYGLSPVLVSLTETISTDTIYAMTSIMMLANILFYNYSPSQSDSGVPGTLSLNAATFASICLASRLNTTWHAFTIVTFSFEWFALWPLFRQRLMICYPVHHNLLTVILGILSFVLLLSLTIFGAVIFVSLHIFINFICPAWLIKLQPYKNNIYGPWDEALPGLHTGGRT